MKRVKTAKGRILDMGALAAKHETVRAVSNLNMNARGDIIDSRNQVKISRENISKEYYKNNVPGSDETEVSIKEEVVTKTTTSKTENVNPDEPIEVSRRSRERADGTQYVEIEYDDGSIAEYSVDENGEIIK